MVDVQRVRTPKNVSILIIELMGWVVILCLLAWSLFQTTNPAVQTRVSVISGVLVSVFGVRAFLGHAQRRISVLGLFNLSTALFIGVAGIYTALDADNGLSDFYLACAIVGSFAVQVATTALAWGRNTDQALRFTLPPDHAAHWATRWGMFLLVILAIVQVASDGGSIRAYIEAGAFVSITVLAIGVLWREQARIYSWRTVMLLGCLVLYAELFHSGQGRLRVVALACTIGVLVSIRFQKRIVKLAVVGLIPLALLWLSYDRLSLQESLQTGASEGRTGLESMMSPIIVFAQLLEAQQVQGFPLSYGYNLLSFLALLAPGEAEPRALGYELVQITSPERYGSGYSVVASSTGEAVYNFGLFGFVVVVPVVAFIVHMLDKLLARTVTKVNLTTFGLIAIVFWAICAGSFADFTWSGQHTYLARIAMRLPFIAGLAIFAWIYGSRTRQVQRPRAVGFR